MECNPAWELEDGIEVPASALVRVERPDRYGSVPGLDDEELADLDELERQLLIEAWGPTWRLPQEPRQWRPWPTVDQEGNVDWGAFGTVDFLRTQDPPFSMPRYKADKLQEELRDALIMMSIV